MAENPAQSPSKKWIEPVVAVLMALTTICTAWCSYESATWTRQSNRLMNESNALEQRAALLEVQGNQALIVHTAMFMQLLAAQHFGNEKLASSFLPSYECSPYACGLTNSPSVYFKTKPIREC
jgi:Na+/melibiose symporter-like transporter